MKSDNVTKVEKGVYRYGLYDIVHIHDFNINVWAIFLHDSADCVDMFQYKRQCIDEINKNKNNS